MAPKRPAFPRDPAFKASKPNPRVAERKTSRPKGFEASKAQRDAVRGRACVVCRRQPTDPSHIVDRALGGCSDELCVIPLCRECHRLYDEGRLSLLEYLEPTYRAELAHGLEHIGLLRLLERVTNEHWAPRVQPGSSEAENAA